jgi:hypothetical protein
MASCLDDYYAAQRRVDAKEAQYNVLRKQFSDAFIGRRIDYDAYIRYSQRLNARFERELSRIHL